MDLEQEKGLVERARKDAEAFGELYDLYYPKVFGYILRRTASVEIAQDITSEVFFKVLKNPGQFCWRGIPFSSWLYRIATNEIASYFRKNKHRRLRLKEFLMKGWEFFLPSTMVGHWGQFPNFYLRKNG